MSKLFAARHALAFFAIAAVLATAGYWNPEAIAFLSGSALA
ncbi:hypothetical protein AB0F15_24120 [Amycolatopsis sp. NPDC026612]